MAPTFHTQYNSQDTVMLALVSLVTMVMTCTMYMGSTRSTVKYLFLFSQPATIAMKLACALCYGRVVLQLREGGSTRSSGTNLREGGSLYSFDVWSGEAYPACCLVYRNFIFLYNRFNFFSRILFRKFWSTWRPAFFDLTVAIAVRDGNLAIFVILADTGQNCGDYNFPCIWTTRTALTLAQSPNLPLSPSCNKNRTFYQALWLVTETFGDIRQIWRHLGLRRLGPSLPRGGW